MLTLLIALGSFAGYLIAYHTYGRWLSRKIFELDPNAVVPSVQLRDDVDYVPTKKSVIFGHHFTSIAGTGPIVGPAIAVFWGWLPALVWVLIGSIFIGAVHDFGALVVSLRNRGQTVGEIAGRLISSRARLLFLFVLFFSLMIVLAIFGLVIALIFKNYPESVLSVWTAMPVALFIGFWVYKRNGSLLFPSIIGVFLLYLAVYLGVYHYPITLNVSNPVMVWTMILMVYCFIASVLPVWSLLQPRDYINSHQLLIALSLLMCGVLYAGATQQADIAGSAPMYVSPDSLPEGALPIWPFLFITIACGACSGFHCLVSSGTSSKQLSCEPDAQYVGYGSMLLEGGLAVLVILSCTAGLGIGVEVDGETLVGRAAWETKYDMTKSWAEFGLGAKVGAFINGGANFLMTIGVPLKLGIGIIAVLVASFAATTLDSATRLQRYVIQELGQTLKIKPLTNMYVATAVAVITGLSVAMIPGSPKLGAGSGGLILWPLFGATNQLLAGLAFMVLVFYLWRRSKPIWFAFIPMVFMLIMPGWGMLWQMFNPESGWLYSGKYLLFGFGLVIMTLQIWMIVEAVFMWKKAKGVLEPELPPLPVKSGLATDSAPSGPNC